MHKRLIFFTFFCCCLFTAVGQLSVSLHEPPAGIVQKSQLWNITLIYSGAESISVTIGLSLYNIQDNQVVMTAFTRPVLITNGVKQLRSADVAPVDYNYFSPAFDISRMPEAFLPIGNYRACYSFYIGKSAEVVLAEDCINLEIAPLTPPQLILPTDTSTLETPYPQFNWMPPAPVTLFSNLNYDLLVVEVFPGQAPESAIQENLPVYSALHLSAPVNNFPGSYKSLYTGKIYAWRIVAKNDEQFAAQSEVWTFKLQNKKPEPLVPANGAYLELKSDNVYVSTGIITDNILGVKYYSYDKTHETSIRFLNERGEVIKEMTKTIEYGNNFIVVKLDHHFDTETTYFIEVNDLQNARYRSSFRIAK
jgi:hypothetical protein